MNTLFRKVLGENGKKKSVFYLKTEKNIFWPTQCLIILKGNTFVWSLVLQGILNSFKKDFQFVAHRSGSWFMSS